jgi:hypothetical protein
MKFETRVISESDYENILKKWWKDWRWDAPAKDFLPFNLEGVMVSKDGVDICACFLYMTNSKICWLEFIVSNFEVKDKVLRKNALSYMIEVAKAMAVLSGKTYIYSSMKNPSLINSMKEFGFLEGSTGCTELIFIKQ